jgi:flagellin-specific chaperone FliS
MYNRYQTQEYRQQDVLGASPIHLVVMAYDLAIQACEKEDFVQVTRVVGCLRDALDFEQRDASLGLFRLYQWCLDCVRQGDYNAALHILQDLREAWAAAEKRLMPKVDPLIQPYANPSIAMVSA